jgi:hypothetical protein
MRHIYQRSHRKLPPPSQLQQSTCHRSRQRPHWTQSSSNVSPHPAQAADAGVEEDGMGRLSFALSYFLTSRFFFSVLLPTLAVAVLYFLSFYLLSLFLYFQ